MLKVAIILTLVFNSFGSLYAMQEKMLHACESGNTKQVKQFIKKDRTLVNAQNDTKLTPLHETCYKGHTKTATLLLKHNADVNAQSLFSKSSPLHIASMYSQTEMVALLLEHNAEVNAQNYNKETPLHLASMWSRTKIIKLLLSHGATPYKPINLFVKYEKYSQTYAQRYESWICKTFVSRKVIVTLLSLIGRKKTTDIPLLPKDMRNLIANYALADEVQEWEQFKKDNPDVAALARIELP